MVQVEIWSLSLTSVKAVGSIAVMAAGEPGGGPAEEPSMDICLMHLIALGSMQHLTFNLSLSLSLSLGEI